MISYVLVMIVSLATGAPTHAVLEGPMSQSWCERLILDAAYRGEDATTRKSTSCLSWPDARRALSRHSCRQTTELDVEEQRQEFDCAPPTAQGAPRPTVAPRPAVAPAPAQATTAASVAAPDLVDLPAPVTEPARLRREERFTGVLVRGRAIEMVPKTFAASDCPPPLDLVTEDGDAVYIRCLSVSDQGKLLAEAKCSGPVVDQGGTRWYRCKESAALYVDVGRYP